MDLFESHLQQRIQSEAPLADRMRPQTLEEFVGQESIIGPGRLLRRAIQADQLSSLIFSGPPGTGKTTLARIIANTTRAHFIALNAVLAGIKDLRAAIDAAQERRKYHGQRTILFVDEVHRFNTAQQDALLPWVENGTVILIGATTENPYFSVNKALVSRSRLFQLKPLQAADLRRVAEQALTDPARGYGGRQVDLDPDALAHLVNVANGDARSLLNALELAVETTLPQADGSVRVNLAVAEESIQQRAVLYDREGDVHFDIISAFIKSLRGSDPDAALYWLARMVYAGEDPRFIFRRMAILASEDVGLADPLGIQVVMACAAAFDRVGLPEGQYSLAQAALYLATAPKSNSVMGYFDALAAVERQREGEVPNPLKDSNRDQQGLGHGAGYRYPHAYRDHWVAQQYLPKTLQGQVFYQPSQQGHEARIRQEVARRREEQMAALALDGPLQILSFGPTDRAEQRWLQRTLSQAGSRLGAVRDQIFTLAGVARHHLVLDLQAGSTSLLTWEALRQAPEGGVVAVVASDPEQRSLQEQAAALSELRQPKVIVAELAHLPEALSKAVGSSLRFDRILGYNALLHQPDKPALAEMLPSVLAADGILVLAESVPRLSQRVYSLVDPGRLESSLYQRWTEAEEAIYRQTSDPMVNWDPDLLAGWFGAAGWQVRILTQTSDLTLSAGVLARWFSQGNDRATYADHLSQRLAPNEVERVRQTLHEELRDKTVSWKSTIAFLHGSLLSGSV